MQGFVSFIFLYFDFILLTAMLLFYQYSITDTFPLRKIEAEVGARLGRNGKFTSFDGKSYIIDMEMIISYN